MKNKQLEFSGFQDGIRPECMKCKLWEKCVTPFMHPDDRSCPTDEFADMLIVGEAPGYEEDNLGVPFVGKSGRLLREIINSVGLGHYNIVYTNVNHCRPPENKTPSAAQMNYCLELLESEIKDYNPRIVILLGNNPLKALLHKSGITNWRGVVVERDGMVYMPTFHPAYVLRSQSALADVLGDFEKVVDLLLTGNKSCVSADADYTWSCIDTAEEALIMADAIRKAGLCSFDTETTSLRPYDAGTEIVMCSFAVDNPTKRAWAIDMHSRSCSDSHEIGQIVMGILVDSGIKKIGHNIKFDALSVLMIWGVWIESIIGDSMLLSYILDSQPGGHGLKVLAGRFLGMYDYDKELQDFYDANRGADPSRGGDIQLVPVDILAHYAARDAIAALELHKLLERDLTDAQRILYAELLMPASQMLTQMEAGGVPVDPDVLREYIQLYASTQEQQMYAMLSDPTVEKFIRDMRKDKNNFEFNPNSTNQMQVLLFGKRYFNLKPVGLTDGGQPSTKWDYIKIYKDDAFIASYRYYKLLGKMLSTYLIPVRDDWPSTKDGFVRANYLIHGTVTGRLSSRAPNLQNIPTPEKEPGTILESHPIKNIFTNSFDGGCLLAVDYSGMELRTMAAISKCSGMKKVFEQGQDLHSIVTCHLFGLDFEDFMSQLKSDDEELAQSAKAKRYRAKWVNWTLLYGGSAYTLQNLYDIPKKDAEQLVALYYNLFPEVLEYRQSRIEFARANGYVESPFGRRRYLPYINDQEGSYRSKAEREATNMPIQSAASDILLCALIILDRLVLDYGFNSMMVNTVHDSVMFDVYPDELDDLSSLCKDVMENIVLYGPKHFPGLDFSWFDVPLVVDMEYGSHYGSLIPI